MKRGTAAVAVFLLGVAADVLVNRAVAFVCLGLGLMLLLTLIPAVYDRLPRLALTPGNAVTGPSVTLVPAPGSAKRRLRAETLSLVKDMHAYVQNAPPSRSPNLPMGLSLEERVNLFNEQTTEILAESQAESRVMSEKFGARTANVAEEFERRQMITGYQGATMSWQAQAGPWNLARLAVDLEALARKLDHRQR